jgi:hypothetical protein
MPPITPAVRFEPALGAVRKEKEYCTCGRVRGTQRMESSIFGPALDTGQENEKGISSHILNLVRFAAAPEKSNS